MFLQLENTNKFVVTLMLLMLKNQDPCLFTSPMPQQEVIGSLILTMKTMLQFIPARVFWVYSKLNMGGFFSET